MTEVTTEGSAFVCAEKERMRQVVTALIVLAAIMSFAGCAQPRAEESIAPAVAAEVSSGDLDEQAPVRCHAPVLVTVHRDMSRSTDPNGTPDVTEVDLQVLIEQVLGVCGGELFYGEIGANSSKPLHRLRIDEPPPAPLSPGFDSNPFIRAEQKEQFRSKWHHWEENRAAWASAAAAEAETFLEQLRPSLALRPNEGATDIEGAVDRALVALNEPPLSWSVTPRKVMLLATDGLHTTKRTPSDAPSSDVRVIVAGSPGVLERLSPVVFESTAAAVRSVRLLAEEEK